MPSRYLIGIDLGTTNSVVAYIDTRVDAQEVADAGSLIHVFPVPQLVEHGEVRTLPALPSFLYFPTADELSAGAVSATWDEDPPMVTGVLAREQGVLVPSRQVSSATSWSAAHWRIILRCAAVRALLRPPRPDAVLGALRVSQIQRDHRRSCRSRSRCHLKRSCHTAATIQART